MRMVALMLSYVVGWGQCGNDLRRMIMKNEEICEEEKCRCWSHKNIRGNDVEVSEELREKPSYFRKRILKPLRKDVGNLNKMFCKHSP